MPFFSSLDPIIAFFFLGAFASWIKSDLEIPDAAAKFLSIFLLLSLGLKGGHEVRTADGLEGFITILSIGFMSCLIIPTLIFIFLKKRLGDANAASLAACYGSVSAVTFIAAQSAIESQGLSSSGYMTAVMALMEIPAIIFALYLFKKSRKKAHPSDIEFHVFSGKSVIMLLGGFAIGLLMEEKSWAGMSPLIVDGFKGALAFFLLGLGIQAQRQVHEAWNFRFLALGVACVLPLVWGTLAMAIGWAFGIREGNLVLLATLVGSSSYIAAPAAIQNAIPESNPSLYVALPLALTFPMNVTLGIPYYMGLMRYLG